MKWVAAERTGTGEYVRHPDSPEFTDVGALMSWLEERGLITRRGEPHDDRGYAGWGNPWFAVPTDKAMNPAPPDERDSIAWRRVLIAKLNDALADLADAYEQTPERTLERVQLSRAINATADARHTCQQNLDIAVRL